MERVEFNHYDLKTINDRTNETKTNERNIIFKTINITLINFETLCCNAKLSNNQSEKLNINEKLDLIQQYSEMKFSMCNENRRRRKIA